MAHDYDPSSLALALSGFSVPAESQLSAQRAGRGGGSKLKKVVCEVTAPLVRHARTVATAVVRAAAAPDYDPTSDLDSMAQLCFALRSTCGTLGRFSDEDEIALWELSQQLWECSMERYNRDVGKPDLVGDALASMASELFELVEADLDAPQDAPTYVTFFCQAARTWARLGKTQYAGDCLRRAMRYAEALEAMVEDPGTSLAPPQRERHTVQLFDLYLTAARHAAATQRQALANNLLSRALALSRHAAAGPVAAVCMCISVAELQLQQAQGMLARGDILLAVALLTTAYQQLCSPDLPLAAVTQEEHLDGLLESKKQVLLELCRAYLAANDARMAHKCLEALDREGAQGTQWAASPEVHSMVLRVKLAAGRLAEALHLLSEAARAADPAAPEGQQLLQAWLGGLGMALPHVCPAELHAFQAVVTAFVWRAVAWPQLLLQLVQVLLAQDEGEPAKLCRQLALEVLALEDVAASLYHQPPIQHQVHGMLWHRAVACFQAGDAAASRALLSAALQLARPSDRPKNARMLAACHSKLGEQRRALEYLAIAARHEQQPSCLTLLYRLDALAQLGQSAEAMAVIKSLEACQDFHPSCLKAVCRAASSCCSEMLAKEASALALRMLLVKPEGTSCLPAGQEAGVVLHHMCAVLKCIDAAPTSGPGLFNELVQATKLATRRMKLLGAERFAGGPRGGAAAITLRAITDVAAGGVSRALRQGALEQTVMLATALCVLLHLTNKGGGQPGRLQQGRMIMLAVQALLNLHESATSGTDRAHKLDLAAKLSQEVSQHLGAAYADQASESWALHHLLSLTVAARQQNISAVAHCLECLQQGSHALTVAQRQAILDAVGSTTSTEAHGAAARVLVDSVVAERNHAALAQLPSLLRQLALSPQHQLDICQVCLQQQLLLHDSDNSHGVQPHLVGQWMSVWAWNTGVQMAESKDELGIAFMEVAVALGEAAAVKEQPARMKAALGAVKSRESDARQPADEAAGAGHASPAGREPAPVTLAAGLEGSGLAAASGSSKEVGEVAQPGADTGCGPGGAVPAGAGQLSGGQKEAEPATEGVPQGADVAMGEVEEAEGPEAGGQAMDAQPEAAAHGEDRHPSTSIHANQGRVEEQEAAAAARPALPSVSAVASAAVVSSPRPAPPAEAAVEGPVTAAHQPAADVECHANGLGCQDQHQATTGTEVAANLGASAHTPLQAVGLVGSDELEELSEEDEEEVAGQAGKGLSWLDAIFAAQQRALGASAVPQPKRAAPATREAPVRLGARKAVRAGDSCAAGLPHPVPSQVQQQAGPAPAAAAPVPGADNADALSLCDSDTPMQL